MDGVGRQGGDLCGVERIPPELPLGRRLAVENILYRGGDTIRWDLSHGTNLLPTSPPIAEGVRILTAVDAGITRYDDPIGAHRLREAIAAYERAMIGGRYTAGDVVVTAGAREALHLAYRGLAEQRGICQVILVGPQFGVIHAAIAAAGLTLLEVIGPADAYFEPDIASVCELIRVEGPGTAVHLTNPTNPSGRLWTTEEMEALLSAVTQVGGWLVLDKVGADLASDHVGTVPPLLPLDDPGLDDLTGGNVIVIDTFSKRRSVAGLRVGYLLASDRALVHWVGERLYGGTQVGAIVDALVTDLEIATAVMDAWGTAPAVQVGEYMAAVAANHRTMVANLVIAVDVLGPWLAAVSPFDGGQNVAIELDLPPSLDDLGLVRTLMRGGLATYPVSAFMARRKVPRRAMHSLRLTLSIPPDDFGAACRRARELLSAVPAV